MVVDTKTGRHHVLQSSAEIGYAPALALSNNGQTLAVTISTAPYGFDQLRLVTHPFTAGSLSPNPTETPAEAQVIDATRKFVLPGFVEMHGLTK